MDFGMNSSGIGWENPLPEEIAELLKSAKTIAVVGLSAKPERPSYGVSKYLQAQGYKIIPVNPNESMILGEKAYPDLNSIPNINEVDIVDVFRRPDDVPNIVDSAIKLGVKAIWLQEDVISTEAFHNGRQASVFMVMDRCILKEHNRLIMK